MEQGDKIKVKFIRGRKKMKETGELANYFKCENSR